MKQYHDALAYVLEHGEQSEDRTGVGTVSVFGYQMRFNLQQGFPAITTKRLAWKAVGGELLWFLEGSTDERRLAELTYEKPRTDLVDKQTIWTANADAQGVALGYTNNLHTKELGKIYGYQWRAFNKARPGQSGSIYGVDQVEWLINEIKTNPTSRRLILTAWNPSQLKYMALPPCHLLAQFYVRNNKLSCQLYQRSADLFLGSPFNIASYALLTHMLAQICGLDVGELVYTIGDAHIYSNHIEQVKTLLQRTPPAMPNLIIKTDNTDIDGYKLSDFALENYTHLGEVKGDIAV
jgi:thymidylate synthase